MITSANTSEIRAQVKAWHINGESVAFVPTMGNLHQGHIRLVQEAAHRADHVVVSIFVNPMQFGEGEDLDAYPRTLEADKLALVEAGASLLFVPSVESIYPKGLASQTYVDVPQLSEQLCGQSRPGHFRGVATIVCKLFHLVQPDLALFGKKDYQQLLVIRTMVEDLSMPIDIIGIDTIRETSGLAMSSRNGYLTPEELAIAPGLKVAIDAVAAAIKSGVAINTAVSAAKAELTELGFTPDYLVVRNAKDLAEVTEQDKFLVILAAAHLGKARLIDNLEFER